MNPAREISKTILVRISTGITEGISQIIPVEFEKTFLEYPSCTEHSRFLPIDIFRRVSDTLLGKLLKKSLVEIPIEISNNVKKSLIEISPYRNFRRNPSMYI